MRFLGLRMVTGDMSGPLVLASSVIEVRDHHHGVGLTMTINFMYNMSI